LLLAKALPDLSQVQHIGDKDHPIEHSVEVKFRD
jgi:hypothetical protein